MQPEISVLMSCYNAEKWLSEAIDSLLSQTYENFDLILINDGSNDDTVNIIAKYEKLDHRIKVISKSNTGLPDSLNVGILQARGKWIARLDADDISEPSRLEEQLNFVKSNDKVLLLGTGFSEIDTNGEVVKIHRFPTQHKSLKYHLEYFQTFFPHSSAFYKTSAVKYLGGYRPQIRVAEDIDLWLRLLERGDLGCLDRPLVRIRKHDNQISHSESGKRQMVDAYAANISYFIRQFGKTDPIQSNTDCSQFIDWVEMCLDEDGIFDSSKNWEIARADFFNNPNRLLGGLDLTKYLFTSKNTTSRIKKKLIGSNIGQRLATKWIRINS